MGYHIHIIIGKDHPMRGVAFLVSEDKIMTAKKAFDNLDRTCERSLRTRFDAWQSGQQNKSTRYHGWNKSEYNGRYTNCFVFKCKSHRFYGFLYNPKEENKRYQICILVSHANKKEWETDEADLKYIEAIRTNLAVIRTVKEFFKEE